MKFNSEDLAEFAAKVGDHEGRLTHKPPPRTLYDTAYKERWFKLRANFLFYYRLNEFGGVDKIEPSGVFILENTEVQREESSEAPFGFSITWKDDTERRHLFFAPNEVSVNAWVNKLAHAGYDHLREQLNTLRYLIRRKTGKDPLEHLGTPLTVQAPPLTVSPASRFHVELEGLNFETEIPCSSSLSVPSSPDIRNRMSKRSKSPSGISLPSKSPSLKVRVPKNPSGPVPPPRRRKNDAANGLVVVDDLLPGIGLRTASFKCHVQDAEPSSQQPNLMD